VRCLSDFLTERDKSCLYSVINDAPQNPASVLTIEDFQNRIEKSRESVKKGLFLTDEELENESSKWI